MVIKDSDVKTYSQGCAALIMVITFIIIVVAYFRNESNNATENGVEYKNDEGTEIESLKETGAAKELLENVLIENVEVLKMYFNSFAKGEQSSLRIQNITIEEGDVTNVFQYVFTKHLALVGTVNKKNSSIEGFILTCQSDGTLESETNIIVAIEGLITSTSPRLSSIERAQVLQDLGLVDSNNLSDGETESIRNGVKYRLVGDNQIGLMFSAEKI